MQGSTPARAPGHCGPGADRTHPSPCPPAKGAPAFPPHSRGHPLPREQNPAKQGTGQGPDRLLGEYIAGCCCPPGLAPAQVRKPLPSQKSPTGQRGLLAGWRSRLRCPLPARHCTPAHPIPTPGRGEGSGCREPPRVFQERRGRGGKALGPPYLPPNPPVCRDSACSKVCCWNSWRGPSLPALSCSPGLLLWILGRIRVSSPPPPSTDGIHNPGSSFPPSSAEIHPEGQ